MPAISGLTLRNFRVFRETHFPRFGNVNLIVGKNSVGKTSLLDALDIYANADDPRAVMRTLKSRDEVIRSLTSEIDSEGLIRSIFENLFHGRKIRLGQENIVTIDPIGGGSLELHTLNLKIIWGGGPDLFTRQEKLFKTRAPSQEPQDVIQPLLTAEQDEHTLYNIPLIFNNGTFFGRSPQWIPEKLRGSTIYIGSGGFDSVQAASMWDKIALSDLENEVVAAARIIDASIERVSLVGDPESDRKRIFIVKLRGLDRPIPLRSLGDGITRLFYIALAAVRAKGDFLLIDEIENGIHYSAQKRLWSTLFKLSVQQSVQVFATTHSFDCIRGFQQAASETDAEGQLIRLESRDGNVVVVPFDEDELEIVTSEGIEIR